MFKLNDEDDNTSQKTITVKNGVTTETTISEDGTVKTIWKIPVGSRKKWWQFWKKDDAKKAKESLTQLMSKYNEEIKFDEKSGEILLPSTIQTCPKEIWYPSPNYDKNNESLNEESK